MAFLDNSGDIILDAVLTDAGRQRMARGQFKIAKYAFGDDEINYSLYNSNHPSGSAYADIEIMQTPVLEAITNNTATMRSKLMSLGRTNILYLPVLRNNENWQLTGRGTNTQTALGDNAGYYLVSSNNALEDAIRDDVAHEGTIEPVGMMFGAGKAAINDAKNYICIDQGMITGGDPSVLQAMDPSLIETQYIVQMDHRLGRVMSVPHNTLHAGTPTGTRGIQRYSFVDDDNIATYYFGFGSDRNMVQTITIENNPEQENNDAWTDRLVAGMDGPLGSRLTFKIKASLNLQQSAALFTKLGGTGKKLRVGTASAANVQNTAAPPADITLSYIDSIVRVTGVTTGYSLDLPVRFLRKD